MQQTFPIRISTMLTNKGQSLIVAKFVKSYVANVTNHTKANK
jgi:hypothetical protein